MYYQNYEDYMRNVLGYSSTNPNIYENYDYQNNFEVNNMTRYPSTYQAAERNTSLNLSEEDVRSLYPDIYHLVSPMINKVCESNREPYTKELIEKMTDEVYMAIEEQTSDVVVNIRAEGKKVPETELRSESIGKRPESLSSRQEPKRDSFKSNKQEGKREESNNTRQELRSEMNTNNKEEIRREGQSRQRNYLLRDLIKILLLNRIIGGNRPPIRPPRPPYPGGPGMPPPRPPYPGGRPPMGGGRPPMPRDYLDF